MGIVTEFYHFQLAILFLVHLHVFSSALYFSSIFTVLICYSSFKMSKEIERIVEEEENEWYRALRAAVSIFSLHF